MGGCHASPGTLPASQLTELEVLARLEGSVYEGIMAGINNDVRSPAVAEKTEVGPACPRSQRP